MTRQRILKAIAEHGRLETNARILKDWPKNHLHKRQKHLWTIHLRKYEHAATVVAQFARHFGQCP